MTKQKVGYHRNNAHPVWMGLLVMVGQCVASGSFEGRTKLHGMGVNFWAKQTKCGRAWMIPVFSDDLRKNVAGLGLRFCRQESHHGNYDAAL